MTPVFEVHIERISGVMRHYVAGVLVAKTKFFFRTHKTIIPWSVELEGESGANLKLHGQMDALLLTCGHEVEIADAVMRHVTGKGVRA